MKSNNLNVYKGAKGLEDYLNPTKYQYLPLVEIPSALNPFYGDGVRIYAKLMSSLPLGNIKSLPAYNMLKRANENDALANVNNIIENSSGNTVMSLSVLGRLFGISKTTAIASNEVSNGKLDLLRFFGVNVIVNQEPICPDMSDKNSGIYKATKIGKRKGWFNPGQYNNPANPEAHQLWTAKQIWHQTQGKINIFCAGLGTTGTLVGSAKFLKKNNPNIKVIGAVRSPNNPVPGVRTKNLLSEIDFDWSGLVDSVETIGTKNSFAKSLELCQEGIVVGPSSGFAFSALLVYLQKLKDANRLKDIKKRSKQIHAVFICPDLPYVYINDYFKYLDQSYFGKLENAHLLVQKVEGNKNYHTTNQKFTVEPDIAFSAIYGQNPNVIWDKLRSGKEVVPKNHIVVFDLRDQEQFNQFHLPGSKQISYDDVLNMANRFLKLIKNKSVYLICAYGVRTEVLANLLSNSGVYVNSIGGGMLRWSELDLPRWRPDICLVHDKL